MSNGLCNISSSSGACGCADRSPARPRDLRSQVSRPLVRDRRREAERGADRVEPQSKAVGAALRRSSGGRRGNHPPPGDPVPAEQVDWPGVDRGEADEVRRVFEIDGTRPIDASSSRWRSRTEASRSAAAIRSMRRAGSSLSGRPVGSGAVDDVDDFKVELFVGKSSAHRVGRPTLEDVS
jgi:hypothetical protein